MAFQPHGSSDPTGVSAAHGQIFARSNPEKNGIEHCTVMLRSGADKRPHPSVVKANGEDAIMEIARLRVHYPAVETFARG